MIATDKDWRPFEPSREAADLVAENELLRVRVAELEASMDAAQAAIVSECVEHVELNGHIEVCEQLSDYLSHEIMDSGDPSGKLSDFVGSLNIVIDQFDKQRRRANWHEAGYKAGKQKVIDYAVEKALAPARAAARTLAARIDDLGMAVDDNDPAVMATAGPIGEAEAALFDALGILEEERARREADELYAAARRNGMPPSGRWA